MGIISSYYVYDFCLLSKKQKVLWRLWDKHTYFSGIPSPLVYIHGDGEQTVASLGLLTASPYLTQLLTLSQKDNVERERCKLRYQLSPRSYSGTIITGPNGTHTTRSLFTYYLLM